MGLCWSWASVGHGPLLVLGQEAWNSYLSWFLRHWMWDVREQTISTQVSQDKSTLLCREITSFPSPYP
ncbi:hypothetical protein BgiBS90_036492 [Biomphalaria glabrata]|nr:hypothetical protein BgiBS90_036492 [Biomphalaria glabrata]